MTLLMVQREVARLCSEFPALQAWRRDPAGYARQRGLRGQHAALLAGIGADGLAFFAARRRIDRAAYARADLGRTVRLLERLGQLDAYFDAHPYAHAHPLREARRLARWVEAQARTGRLPPHAADLARLDLAVRLLLRQAHRPARATRRPCVAPGVQVLRLEHDLLGQLQEPTILAAPARPTVAALHRTPHDVQAYRLDRLDEALLEAARGDVAEDDVVALVARRASTTRAKVRAALTFWRGHGLVGAAR